MPNDGSVATNEDSTPARASRRPNPPGSKPGIVPTSDDILTKRADSHGRVVPSAIMDNQRRVAPTPIIRVCSAKSRAIILPVASSFNSRNKVKSRRVIPRKSVTLEITKLAIRNIVILKIKKLQAMGRVDVAKVMLATFL